MDSTARAAYVNSQVACAMAELEAMRAANLIAIGTGQTGLPYGPEDFRALEGRFMIGHNAVVMYLREG